MTRQNSTIPALPTSFSEMSSSRIADAASTGASAEKPAVVIPKPEISSFATRVLVM